MNIDERIVILVGEINEVQQQTKSVEGQIIILQQRHQALTFSYARLEGALSAFTEIKNDSEKTEEPS
jgi:uncharacterized protein involved in exopolysaccharide biosynthesis